MHLCPINRSHLLVVLITVTAWTASFADVPQLINYQARLTDTTGNPLNGTYQLRFRIYGAATGGSALWTETHTGVAISNGYVSLLMGSVTAFPADLFTNASRYLSIQVGSDPEMTPRSRLVTSPYAFMAEKAQALFGKPGQTFNAPNPPITETSIGSGITDTITVSGGPNSITNVTVTVNFSPLGEVGTLYLQSPAGTKVYLVDFSFGGSIIANFDNERFPARGSMDDFDGQNANGVWTLRLSTGTGSATPARLNSWSLTFNDSPCQLCWHADGHRIDALALTTRELRMHNDAGSETIRMSTMGTNSNVIIGGNGGYGNLSLWAAGTSPFFQVGTNNTMIGGGGYPGTLVLTNGTSSRMILYGSDGSILMDGDLHTKKNVQVDGNLTVTGTKSAVVKTDGGIVRAVYADESAEVYLFDRGRAQLTNGSAVVRLDPIFLQTVTVSDRHPLWVTVTPTAPCKGIYVKQTGEDSFTVEELLDGRSSATFNWEVGAKRRGFEATRLEPVGQ